MISRFQYWLFAPVDNAGLAAFRVLYGLILAAEAFGALATGWVTKIFVNTEFTFGFIGFQCLADALHGPIMYFYYGLLGLYWVLMMAFGYKYKLATTGYFILWWAVYLSQKSHYNNHYYLMVILTGLMFFIDCNRFFSVDSKHGKVERSNYAC